MGICAIFCGGEVSNYEFIKKYINQCNYFVCADSGYLHCKNLSIIPDIIIGDFDSYCGKLPKGVQIIKTIPEKDDTDSLMAVKHVLKMGFDTIYFFGAAGGRLDHTLANLSVMQMVKNSNKNAVMIDEKSIMFIIKNQTINIPQIEGYFISVFPFGGDANGVCLKCLKYPLTDYTLKSSYPIGVSNEFMDGQIAKITVKSGSILVLICKKE